MEFSEFIRAIANVAGVHGKKIVFSVDIIEYAKEKSLAVLQYSQ